MTRSFGGRIAAPPFKLEMDGRRKMLVATMSGYWDMAICAEFAIQLRATLRRMKLLGGCDYYLADASDFAVQSADVAQALQTLVDSLEPNCPRRMAGVIGGQLNKMQARRSGEAPGRQVFASIEDARAWLFS